MSGHECPKCQLSSPHTADICPRCGLVWQKWLARQQHPQAPTYRFAAPQQEGLLTRLSAQIFAVPDYVDPSVFWGRTATFVGLVLWSLYFITGGVDWERIGSTFLHNVNLPFHEFGHVLFRPFGHFMTILGGSLFQCIMPLGLMLAFCLYRADNFGASVMLWWSGQNFIDVSPYIADAQLRALPLIGGGGEESHDWGNLLTMTHSLDHTRQYAHTSFSIGVVLIILALAWAAYILHLQKQRLADVMP